MDTNLCSAQAASCNSTTVYISGVPIKIACPRTCGNCVQNQLSCSSSLCQNGATCYNVAATQNTLFSFFCQCPIGYSGQFCELSEFAFAEYFNTLRWRPAVMFIDFREPVQPKSLPKWRNMFGLGATQVPVYLQTRLRWISLREHLIRFDKLHSMRNQSMSQWRRLQSKWRLRLLLQLSTSLHGNLLRISSESLFDVMRIFSMNPIRSEERR